MHTCVNICIYTCYKSIKSLFPESCTTDWTPATMMGNSQTRYKRRFRLYGARVYHTHHHVPFILIFSYISLVGASVSEDTCSLHFSSILFSFLKDSLIVFKYGGGSIKLLVINQRSSSSHSWILLICCRCVTLVIGNKLFLIFSYLYSWAIMPWWN